MNSPDRHPWRRTVALLLLNLVGAAVVPPLLAWLLLDPKKDEKFTDVQNFGIATLTFIALALAEVVMGLEELRHTHRLDEKIVAARSALEAELGAIRDACLAQGDSLMARYTRRQIQDLRRSTEAAVGSGEIEVDERSLYFSDLVVDQMRGEPDDIVRLVHRFSDNHMIVRAHELEWLRKVDEKVRQKQVLQVRRIFVCTDDDEPNAPLSRSLQAAHLGDRRYACRLIRSDSFADLLQDHLIPPAIVDFGLYGKRSVFKGWFYGDGELRGSYGVVPEEIDRYCEAFDACWQSAAAWEPTISHVAGEDLPNSMRGFLASARKWNEAARGKSSNNAAPTADHV